ncbi:hypothetical protein M378DRAFT_15854 [Amanita muscaria Koide BX008]|uniref:Uncharacterized protein n=1 Tax=Amanita muscaria (strain Koide BX008) TaxID=946122 RepID=A0A0C2WP27_AMAMK|nr:hypothetical protein M378DRAFT_15854 [Amanita muscaria Koide BX008]
MLSNQGLYSNSGQLAHKGSHIGPQTYVNYPVNGSSQMQINSYPSPEYLSLIGNAPAEALISSANDAYMRIHTEKNELAQEGNQLNDVRGSAESRKPADAEPKIAEPGKAVSKALEGLWLRLRASKAAAVAVERACTTIDAQEAPITAPTLLTTPTLTVIPPDPVHIDPSIPGSLPITPATSQASFPPSTAPPSESERQSDQDKPSVSSKGRNKHKRCKNSAQDNAQTDEHGMYQDVNVMEIDSDSPDPSKKNKNKNAKADIDHFFQPIVHIKGEKRGQRRNGDDGNNKTTVDLVDEHTTL